MLLFADFIIIIVSNQILINVNHSYTISIEGDTLIKKQIKKSLESLIVTGIIAIICGVLFYSRIDTIERRDIIFLILSYLFMFAAPVLAFVRKIKFHPHLAKSITIDGDIISITGYGTYGKKEYSYLLNIKEYKLEKGIHNKKDKSFNIYEVKDTYTLVSTENPKQHFFFLSSFWEQWDEIQGLLSDEHIESKAGQYLNATCLMG